MVYKFKNKPKLIKCNRNISGAGGGTLNPVGEYFVQLQIGKENIQRYGYCNRKPNEELHFRSSPTQNQQI